MKIVIDARFYGPVGKGLGRYVQRLIEHLELIDSEHDFVILLGKQNWEEYTPHKSNFSKVLADFPWYGFEEQFQMVKLLWKLKPDLVHFPHFNVPFFYRGKFVVTIHDLILLKYPTRRASRLGFIRYWFKHMAYRIIIRHAVKASQHVLTVSEYTKNTLIDEFHIPKHKVSVIYQAGDGGVESGQQALPTTETNFETIQSKYILYIGNAYPHKNLEMLIQAYALLPETLRSEYRLVLVGKNDYFYSRLKQYTHENFPSLKEHIIFWGFAPQASIADLYRNASVYVMPSLYEGFGLPPLEAMYYGTPVVSSNATCLPEVLGDAALYFDPEKSEEMTKALHTSLTDEDIRKDLIARGHEQIKKYNWKDFAKKTYDIYTKYKN